MIAIMLLAIVNGILTSIALETGILSRQMPLRSAFQTAVGMSLISMVAMEIAMNLVDVALTGGAVLNLWVLPVMFAAGFWPPCPTTTGDSRHSGNPVTEIEFSCQFYGLPGQR